MPGQEGYFSTRITVYQAEYRVYFGAPLGHICLLSVRIPDGYI